MKRKICVIALIPALLLSGGLFAEEVPFNNGSGSVFIDEVEFDESAQCYMVQVSIPVMNGNTAVGAITFGIYANA